MTGVQTCALPIYGAGFENRYRVAAILGRMIDDGGYAVVGRNFQEVRFELIALADVDGFDGVVESGLLQEQGDFVAVWGSPVVEIDHRISSVDARLEETPHWWMNEYSRCASSRPTRLIMIMHKFIVL